MNIRLCLNYNKYFSLKQICFPSFANIMQYLLSVERGHLPAEQGERGKPNHNREGECKGRREWLCRCEDHVLFLAEFVLLEIHSWKSIFDGVLLHGN